MVCRRSAAPPSSARATSSARVRLRRGYVFGARQSVKAYFSLRSRRHSTQNQHKIEALERERIRLQADVLLDFVQSETRADSLREELVGDIQKEIKLFDRKLTTDSDLVEAVARLTDRARQLPLLHPNWLTVIPVWALAGGIAATLVIDGLAGLSPAIRASRLSPTETLSTPYDLVRDWRSRDR